MASKKSFKSDNPALMYITPTARELHGNGQGEDTQHTQDMYKTQYTDNTHKTQPMYTHNTDTENKTKRLNLLLRPSLHEQAQKIAHIKRSSVNDIINLALAQYVAENRADIVKYDQIYQGESK